MVKALIHLENKSILNISIFNNRTSKYINQRLIEIQQKKRQIPNCS